MKSKTIEVRAARTQTQVLNHQCDLVEDYFDTIAEAKRRARYYLTDDFRRIIEASEPMRYSQVIVNGECIADYFAKGYNGESCDRLGTNDHSPYVL